MNKGELMRPVKKVAYHTLVVRKSDKKKFFVEPAREDKWGGIVYYPVRVHEYTVVLGETNTISLACVYKLTVERLLEEFEFIFPETKVNPDPKYWYIKLRNYKIVKEYITDPFASISSLQDKYGVSTIGDILKRNTAACQKMVIDEYIRENINTQDVSKLSDDEKTGLLFSKINARARNGLRRYGYNNIKDIYEAVLDDSIFNIKNVGVIAIKSIVDVLREFDYAVPDKYFVDSISENKQNGLYNIPYVKPYEDLIVNALDNDPHYSYMARFSSLNNGITYKGIALLSRTNKYVSIYWISNPGFDKDILNKISSGFLKFFKEKGCIKKDAK
jgi:hypothetical protein